MAISPLLHENDLSHTFNTLSGLDLNRALFNLHPYGNKSGAALCWLTNESILVDRFDNCEGRSSYSIYVVHCIIIHFNNLILLD